ncbi:membrane protein-related [Anaeramoeba flamelloides]|uniref:Membrane protein-related n=1 Tax=Anaeramoeba flamelloides TaxID=1746091 RepID=A0AAV7YZN7_9EUKA|nr:membrane protein-related [Anaeramoeba flamelloides]
MDNKKGYIKVGSNDEDEIKLNIQKNPNQQNTFQNLQQQPLYVIPMNGLGSAYPSLNPNQPNLTLQQQQQIQQLQLQQQQQQFQQQQLQMNLGKEKNKNTNMGTNFNPDGFNSSSDIPLKETNQSLPPNPMVGYAELDLHGTHNLLHNSVPPNDPKDYEKWLQERFYEFKYRDWLRKSRKIYSKNCGLFTCMLFTIFVIFALILVSSILISGLNDFEERNGTKGNNDDHDNRFPDGGKDDNQHDNENNNQNQIDKFKKLIAPRFVNKIKMSLFQKDQQLKDDEQEHEHGDHGDDQDHEHGDHDDEQDHEHGDHDDDQDHEHGDHDDDEDHEHGDHGDDEDHEHGDHDDDEDHEHGDHGGDDNKHGDDNGDEDDGNDQERPEASGRALFGAAYAIFFFSFFGIFLTIGIWKVVFKAIRNYDNRDQQENDPLKFSNLFSGFKEGKQPFFGVLWIVIVQIIFSSFASIPQGIMFTAIGWYFSLIWMWSVPFWIANHKNFKIKQAFGLSRKLVHKRVFGTIWLYILSCLIILLGFLCFGIGALFAIPFVCVFYGVAYSEIFGLHNVHLNQDLIIFNRMSNINNL